MGASAIPVEVVSTPDQVVESLKPTSFKHDVRVLDSVLAAWGHMERLVGLLCPVILGAIAELSLVRCPVAVALESTGPSPWSAVLGHAFERQVEASFGEGECPQERFADRLKSPRGTGDWTYGGLCLLFFSFCAFPAVIVSSGAHRGLKKNCDLQMDTKGITPLEVEIAESGAEER